MPAASLMDAIDQDHLGACQAAFNQVGARASWGI